MLFYGAYQNLSSTFGIGIIVLFSLLSSQPAKSADARHRLLTDAPQAWKRLESQLSDRVELRGVLSQSIKGNNKRKETVKHFYYASREEEQLLKLGRDKGRETIFCVNDRHGFMLETSTNTRDYVVKHIGPVEKADEDDFVFELKGFIFQSYSLADRKLSDVILDPQFQLREASEFVRGEESLIMVKFDYLPTKPSKAGFPPVSFRNGLMVLDPAHSWGIREYQFESNRGFTTCQVEYGDTKDGVPILKQVIQEGFVNREKTGGQTRTACTFDSWERRDVGKRAFTLEAFGLPDVTSRPANTPNGYGASLIFLFLGVVFALSAFMIRRSKLGVQTR